MKHLIISLIILTGCAHSPQPWTKAEKVLLVASCLATVADTYTTMEMRDNGYEEMNPMMDEHPSDGEVIVVLGIGQIAAILLAHYWPAFRTWGLGAKTIFNGGLAVHNSNLE